MEQQDIAIPNPATAPKEPLAAVAGTVLVGEIIGLLIAFHVPLTGDQRNAILGVLAAAGPVIAAAWGRLRVYSPKTVARLIARARSGQL